MTFTDLVYATGDVLEKSFEILPMIGNSFNYFCVVLGFVGLFYWLNFQSKKTKEARQNGTYI